MKICMLHLIPWLNIFGLCCDIFGAFLVAWEVVKQFKGKKFNKVNVGAIRIGSKGDDIVQETPEYKASEETKYCRMKAGLVFLTAGFLLQILANVFQIIFH